MEIRLIILEAITRLAIEFLQPKHGSVTSQTKPEAEEVDSLPQRPDWSSSDKVIQIQQALLYNQPFFGS